MKRVLTFIMAVMLIAVSSAPVFAAPTGRATTTNDGKITINNVTAGETYAVYQMAVLESFSGSSYSYWVDSVWRPFFETDAAKQYFSVSNDGYLTTTNNTMQETNKEKMVKDALEFIKTNNIAPAKSTTADSTTVVFEDLNLGYYLVQSSLGTLCALNTTAKEAVVNDKNAKPTVTKKVLDDGNGTVFGDTNDADLFQEMTFRIDMDCKKGAKNYILHDTMTNMVLIDNSIKVFTSAPSSLDDPTYLVDATNYNVITTGLEDGCTFHIEFNQDFCDSMTNNTNLLVYYQASLTKDAVIAGAGNPNKTYLSYGNVQKTEITKESTTTTFTYEFEMVKTDNSGIYLPGAAFTLWDSEIDGNEIKLVKIDDKTYRVAETGETIADKIIMTDGKPVKVYGLDGRTDYYLQEVDAPSGYNKLTARRKFHIDKTNLNITPDGDDTKYSGTEGGVQIINKTGAVLPETGGMGTTMCVLIGSLLVLISGVLLATKLRMAKMRG